MTAAIIHEITTSSFLRVALPLIAIATVPVYMLVRVLLTL